MQKKGRLYKNKRPFLCILILFFEKVFHFCSFSFRISNVFLKEYKVKQFVIFEVRILYK